MEELNVSNCDEITKCIQKREQDRKRIANELHDTTVQDLTHIIHQIELAGLYIDVDPTKAKLELAGINEEIRKVIKDLRNTIYNLRPMVFDDLGLVGAFEQFVHNLKNNYNVNIQTQIDNIQIDDDKKKLLIYRCVQECINNAIKHAEPSLVKLIVKDEDDKIYISVIDDGTGINFDGSLDDITDLSNLAHYGLLILKERVSILNGKCYIKSRQDGGTNITIVVPM